MNNTDKRGRGRPKLLTLEVTRTSGKVWRFGKEETQVEVVQLNPGGGLVRFNDEPYAARLLIGYPNAGKWKFFPLLEPPEVFFSRPLVELPDSGRSPKPSKLDEVRRRIVETLPPYIAEEFDRRREHHPNAAWNYSKAVLQHPLTASRIAEYHPPKAETPRPYPSWRSNEPPPGTVPPGWAAKKQIEFDGIKRRLPWKLWPFAPFNFGADELREWTGTGEEWPLTNGGVEERDANEKFLADLERGIYEI